MNLKNFQNLSKRNILGITLVGIGLILIYLIYFPVAKEEIKYQVRRIENKKEEITPPNKDFSIVIPKIGAVAPIVANVDPTDPKKYLPALNQGVAHAMGTALPDEKGNTYLFAHSTDAFYNVGKYNAVFYLLGKLQPGDEVDIYYRGNLIKYEVYDKKVVSPDSNRYLGTILPDEKTLTLQTCYPPGTTFKRLVVLAKQVE